jgi:outer membrane protein OmpA-like peptidoglycan-associated protein
MVEARGYGEDQPLVPNNTPENKQLNRRIEALIWE